MNKTLTLQEFFKSLGFAIQGLKTMLASQRHARVHAIITLIVCILAIIVGISRLEWCLIIIAVVSVWTAEALNTALEFLCDVASPEFHPLVEHAKNVAAGAVLICAIGSVAIGILVFGPA